MKSPIEVSYQPFNSKYQLLYVHNMPLSNFLHIFRDCEFKELRIYWLDGDKDFVSHARPCCPVFNITSCMQGVDALISAIEISLSNGFLIDSNLVDEIFCRIPISLDAQALAESLKRIEKTCQGEPLPSATTIDWNTFEIK